MVESTQNLSVNEVKAKFQTKRGFWLFMNYSVGAYTPDYKSVSMFYLGQLWRGEKSESTSCFYPDHNFAFVQSLSSPARSYPSRYLCILVCFVKIFWRKSMLQKSWNCGFQTSTTSLVWKESSSVTCTCRSRLFNSQIPACSLNTFDQAGFSAYCE